jgi:large subunit ribosomal protein L37Ae
MASSNIRYGASIRKKVRAIKATKSAHYKCEMCGRESVSRKNTSIWECTHCGAIYAGGAYSMTTAAGEVAKRLVEDFVNKSK